MGVWKRLFGAESASAMPTLPQGHEMLGSRSFVFPNADEGNRFMASIDSFRVAYGNDLLSYLRSSYYAEQHRGVMYRSTTGREYKTYGYQPLIFRNDREYLLDRDPTAAMLIEQPWRMLWNGLPTTHIPEVDEFFSEQAALGLTAALQASYQEYYQEGGAFIYLETGSDPETPLQRGERPIAWTYIPAAHVINTDIGPFGYLLTQPGERNPLLDHGIEYISFYPTEMALRSNIPIKVHGSRIFPVNMDARRQKWWRTTHVPFHKVYDSLWELRDILYSRSRAHFQGDPVVVDVDLSADAQKLLNFEGMDQLQKDAMSSMVEQSIRDWNSGVKTTFAPVMGFKMRRLGKSDNPDPKEDVMAQCARLSHGSGIFPIRMILASTKGNSSVTDEDLLILQGNIQNIRDTWGYKHLHKALLMGRIMGANGLRMQDQHDMPAPRDLDWPHIRPLTPRDVAFTEKTDVLIAREAQEMGAIPPARIARKFPRDPSIPLPPWMAVRGRDEFGRNTDVDPKGEPGTASGHPDGAGPGANESDGPTDAPTVPDKLAPRRTRRNPTSPGDGARRSLDEEEMRAVIREELAEALEPILSARKQAPIEVQTED